MINIKKLCFAVAILSATSTLGYGARTFPAPTPPPPPPQESHNNILGDELKYGPIGGAQSKPQVQVLSACRLKYSKALDINTKWMTRFGHTGWFCVYKEKRT